MGKRKLALMIGGLAALIVVGIIGVVHLIKGGGSELIVADGELKVTQSGNTIVFHKDMTYEIAGAVEISGFDFDFKEEGTYKVVDGELNFNEPKPTVYVKSALGDFDLPGDITSGIEDGALVIRLTGTNEDGQIDLAEFSLGKEQADQLGIEGVTAGSKADSGKNKKEAETKMKKQELDATGALMKVESGGNTIAFLPDGTYKSVGSYTQSEEGITVTLLFELEDKYEVRDGKLILLNQGNVILNSDLMASYGYVDTESPAQCTAEIINGILEIHIICAGGDGVVDLATFKIGKEDAEKIGVKGVTGKTEKLGENAGKGNSGTDMSTSGSQQAPAQPPIQPGAKPLSFSGGGGTITFYSNGQYQAEGAVYVGGQSVSCTVTDTYSISGDALSIDTNNQVACTVNFNGQVMSFGAPNVSSVSGSSGGYEVTVVAYANGTYYTFVSAYISADDFQRMKENYGIQGAGNVPEPIPTPSPTPTPPPTPSPRPDDTEDMLTITADVTAEGVVQTHVLKFNLKDRTYSVQGNAMMGTTTLYNYNLGKDTKNGFVVDSKKNSIVMEASTLHMTSSFAGESSYELRVAPTIKTDRKELILHCEIGAAGQYADLVDFLLTQEQADKLGIDVTKGLEEGGSTKPDEPNIPDVPDKPEAPKGSVVLTVTSEEDAVISFYNNNQYMVTGTAMVNGMYEAEITVVDNYKASADALTLANNDKIYAVMFGSPMEVLSDSIATVNADGTVTVKIKGNNGAPMDLLTFTLSVEEAKKLGIGSSTKPSEPTKPEAPKGTIKATSIDDVTGANISFYDNGQYMVTGTAVLNGMYEAEITVVDGYDISSDAVTLQNSGKIYAVMFGSPMEVLSKSIATVNADGTVTVKIKGNNGAPIDLFTFTLSAEEAKKLGIGSSTEPSVPTKPEAPTGTIKATSIDDITGANISFYDNGKYMVTGTAVLNGMYEAEITVVDRYIISSDAVILQNSGKIYAVMFGTPMEVLSDSIATVNADGTVTVKVKGNNGASLELFTFTLSKEESMKLGISVGTEVIEKTNEPVAVTEDVSALEGVSATEPVAESMVVPQVTEGSGESEGEYVNESRDAIQDGENIEIPAPVPEPEPQSESQEKDLEEIPVEAVVTKQEEETETEA